jgi:hypothetical protein
MAGSGQAPTPYDGMGTPTRWDMRTQEEGTPAERFDAVRAERFAPGATRPHDESDDFVRRSLSRYYQ